MDEQKTKINFEHVDICIMDEQKIEINLNMLKTKKLFIDTQEDVEKSIPMVKRM